ncbi:hypothetical protein REPUB_Repub02eG0258600 [Reevesia pubescens]
MRKTEWEYTKQPNSLWPSLPISADEHEDLCAPWRKTLIIKVLGKSVGFNFLWNRLRQIWRLEEDFSLVDLGNDFFLVRVHNPDDYNFIFSEGPWIVAGHYLTVRKWKPLFCPNQETIGTTAVWVRLPGLPLELFNRKLLVDAGNLLGKTVKIDKPTEESSRGKYARICVEVQLDKPLTGGLMIGPIWQKVEYEGLDEICFACGVYGHKAESCPAKSRSEKTMEVPATSPEKVMTEVLHGNVNTTDEPGARFGPWMMTERRSKRNGKNSLSSMNNRTQETTGSRFSLLAAVEEEEKDMNGKDFEGKGHIKNPGLQGGSSSPRTSMPPSKANSGKEKAKALQDITNKKISRNKIPSSGGIRIVEKESPRKTPFSLLRDAKSSSSGLAEPSRKSVSKVSFSTSEGSARVNLSLTPKPAQPSPSSPSYHSFPSLPSSSTCQVLVGAKKPDEDPVALVDSANLSHMEWTESNMSCDELQVCSLDHHNRIHDTETAAPADPMVGKNTPVIEVNGDGDMEGIC